MNRLRCLLVGVMGLLLLAAHGQGGSGKDKLDKDVKDDAKRIEGLWVLETVDEGGKESSGTLSDGGIIIQKQTIEWTNKAGTAKGGTTADITAFDPSKKTMDIKITRGSDINKTKIGIYKFENDRLVLALSDFDQKERPGKFTSKLTAGAARAHSVRTYVRPEQFGKFPNVNQEEAKKLAGLWVLEKGEMEGKEFGPRQGDEAIIIDKNRIRATKANGKGVGGDEADLIGLDPSKDPKTIDWRVISGSSINYKVRGIYKLEGDKLILATSDFGKDERPTKFTSDKSAGDGRAFAVRTYVKAKK
jgi:uncharacterized protein (TIGR03067 family)